MSDYKIIRRMARAALEQAIRDAGIPIDYCVLPHQDDHKSLWVVGEAEVRWMDDDNKTTIATIYFDDPTSGVVAGEEVYRIATSSEFYSDDYGLDARRPFELSFDITDTVAVESQAWESLPLAKLRKRPRVQTPRVVM